MSEAIDAIRNHFNQAPIPKAKCLLDERDKVNAMIDAIEADNANLRELVTYALKHIIEFECEEPDLKRFRGKPCEDCADRGSSDCPKCMPRMFDVSGIEV